MTTVAIGSDMEATAKALLAIAADLDVDAGLIKLVTSSSGGLQFDVPTAVATAYTTYDAPPAEKTLPAAAVFTVTTMPNPLDEDAAMNVVTLAEDGPALAVAIAGDDFPRLILTAAGAVYIGDGTIDTYADGPMVTLSEADPNVVTLAQAALEVADGDVTATTGGFVLASPDAALHRIKVGNDGVLSTEAVV